MPASRAIGAAVLAFASASPGAELTTGIDEQAGLPYWQIADRGMSLRLVQRFPDQTRAFFLARGLGREQVDRVAQSCVFQTVFKNVSDQTDPSPLTYDLNHWEVRHAGHSSGMLTREHWQRIWESEQLDRGAAVAFEWALFPTVQRYEPGDYNWGMSIFGLPPGAEFDLKVAWRQYDRAQEALIEDVRCAPDTEPEISGGP
ncbi:MAG: hypothetical protein PVF91_08220 [Chromatiales bacterium]|jgi:hypothetical protein